MGVSCFQYWNTGIDGMPPMIRYIYEHNKKISIHYAFDLILLTDSNITDYINPHPRFYDLAPNFKSDIVRYTILNKYGGIWLDTDIIIIKDLNILYKKFLNSSYDLIIDNETQYEEPGCASLCMKPNTSVSNFCKNYVTEYLDSNKPLVWGEIGPITIHSLLKTDLKLGIKINKYSITKNGCNFITWQDNPGFNKTKWFFENETDAYNKTLSLIHNDHCYYVITWTIYRKNNINSNIVDFVFNNRRSVFSFLTSCTVNPTFNVVISTLGRPCLQKMLDSLSPQLTTDDCLTIIYDGHSISPLFDLQNFKCKVNQICEETALGYWGHAARNKHAQNLEERTFILHADDDDVYVNYAFSKLRSECIYPNILYIAKIRWKTILYPKMESMKVVEGDIGTPCGIIPYELNKRGLWLNRRGGDGSFYEQISQLSTATVFLPYIIYIVAPSQGDFKSNSTIFDSVPTIKDTAANSSPPTPNDENKNIKAEHIERNTVSRGTTFLKRLLKTTFKIY